MLKKILTYFEMLIVSHALQFVDSCIFVFTSFDTVWHTVLVAHSSPPSLPHKFFYQIELLCQNSLTRELTVRVIGLAPPFPPIFFIRFSFGPLFTASTSPWERPYGEGILLSYGHILKKDTYLSSEETHVLTCLDEISRIEMSHMCELR